MEFIKLNTHYRSPDLLNLSFEISSESNLSQGVDIQKVCGYPLPPSCTGVVQGVLVRVSYSGMRADTAQQSVETTINAVINLPSARSASPRQYTDVIISFFD